MRTLAYHLAFAVVSVALGCTVWYTLDVLLRPLRTLLGP